MRELLCDDGVCQLEPSDPSVQVGGGSRMHGSETDYLIPLKDINKRKYYKKKSKIGQGKHKTSKPKSAVKKSSEKKSVKKSKPKEKANKGKAKKSSK